MNSEPRRIPSLDGLRAVSILLVLCGHSLATLPAGWRIPYVLDPILHNASLGVMVFFVLSGYLITQLLLQELDTAGRIDLRAFYLRRALRIFPVFYGYLLVMGMLALAGVVLIGAKQFLAAGTFLWNYKQLVLGAGHDDGEWYLGHFWSLAVEEQFYLLWPALLGWLGIRRATRACVVALALLPLVRIATYFLYPAARPLISIMFHTASDPIIAGCLLALWPRVRGGTGRLPLPSGRWVLLAAVFVLLVSPHLRQWLRGYYYATVGPLLETAGICLVVVWCVTHAQSLPGRLMNTRPMTWLGRLSYSLYVWNQPFLTTMNQTWSGLFPLNLLCNFVAAWISQQLLEKPFLRWRARLRAEQADTVPPQ